MPYKDKEKQKQYLREYQQDLQDHRLKLRCWKVVWNEEMLKAKRGLTEKKELKCPYCDKMTFRGPSTINNLGMLRHLYESHPDDFTGYFYNLMDYMQRAYDRAAKFVEMVEAKEEYINGLKEGYKNMEKSAMEYRQIAFDAIQQFKAYDIINQLQETMLENLEAKLKGNFKGHNKPLNIKESSEAVGRPTYAKKEK